MKLVSTLRSQGKADGKGVAIPLRKLMPHLTVNPCPPTQQHLKSSDRHWKRGRGKVDPSYHKRSIMQWSGPQFLRRDYESKEMTIAGKADQTKLHGALSKPPHPQASMF